jgi:hypothetical protein
MSDPLQWLGLMQFGSEALPTTQARGPAPALHGDGSAVRRMRFGTLFRHRRAPSLLDTATSAGIRSHSYRCNKTIALLPVSIVIHGRNGDALQVVVRPCLGAELPSPCRLVITKGDGAGAPQGKGWRS